MILEHYYWCFPKAFTPRLCEEVKRFALSQEKQTAITIEEGWDRDSKKNPLTKKEFKKLKHQRNSYATWLNEPWLYKELQPFVGEANKNAKWNFQWDFTEEVQFTHYGKNQHYDWHRDSHVTDVSKNTRGGRMRKLSVSVNLSDPGDYRGGVLQFDFPHAPGSGASPYVCEAMKEKGSLIVFPSFTWHKVTPVTSGKRYSLVCWNWGNPFV